MRRPIEKLLNNFFVNGSSYLGNGIPTNALTFSAKQIPYEISSDKSINNAIRLIYEKSGFAVFHYGPPLYMLGLTEHWEHEEQSGERSISDKNLIKIISECRQLEINRDFDLFRLRKNLNMFDFVDSQFDSPPISLEREFGRFDDYGLPVFYGAETADLCLHEASLNLADDIYIANLKSKDRMRLIDLTPPYKSKLTGSSSDLTYFFYGISLSKDYYKTCRSISRIIRDHFKMDGFMFTSYYSIISKKGKKNISFFGHPIADGKLFVESKNRICLKQINFSYQYGPIISQD